jgi:phosphatidate cytidylyltransferase
VASAVVGVPLILLLILLGGWPYAIVAAIVLAVASAEFQHLRFDWTAAQTIAAAVFAAGIAIAASIDAFAGGVTIASSLVVAAIAGPVASARDRAAGARAWLPLGVLYVGALGCTIVLLRDFHNGRDWVLLALLSTFAVDTAAYFTGRAIGRHALAPRISPKKTWEGFFGGWIGGFAAAVTLNYALGLRIDPAPIVVIAVLLPLAATAGDLLESALKRATGAKDASELIPGHGGVLDRLDSLLLTFPLVYAVAEFVG